MYYIGVINSRQRGQVQGGRKMKIYNISNNSKFINSSIGEAKRNNQENSNKNDEGIRDEYIPIQQEKQNITHENPTYKIDKTTIQRLKAESEKTYSHLRELVRQLLERQGLTFHDLDGLETEIEIDETTRLEAQAMIGEGGPLSPENVSDKIVAFAKAISGGDKSKLDTLKSAIEEGFRQAAHILGGELPEISQKTYDLIMEKLDAWEAEE